MKKRRLYSMWAKSLVIFVMLIAAVAGGISASWALLGYVMGDMTLPEVIHPVSYEESQSVRWYLETEGVSIMDSLAGRARFCAGGNVYDENATVDISDLTAGVGKTDKNPGLEFRLADLESFYGSIGCPLLMALCERQGEFVVYPDGSGVYEDGFYEDVAGAGEVEDTVSGAEPVPSDETAASGTEPVPIDETAASDTDADAGQGGAVLDDTPTQIWHEPIGSRYDYETGEWEGATSFYEIRCYPDLFRVLYYNGIEIEKKFIPTAGGTTVAEYVRQNVGEDPNELLSYYEALTDAAGQVYRMRQNEPESTNALLYLKNADTGAVYTNVAAWEALPLDGIIARYNSDHVAAGRRGAYCALDQTADGGAQKWQTSSGANEETLTDLGASLADQADAAFGDADWILFVGLDTNYPLQDSESYSNALIYDEYLEYNGSVPVNAFVIFCVSLAVFAAMAVVAGFQTGHRPQDQEIHAVPMDRFPIELLFLKDIIAWFIVAAVASEVNYYNYFSRDSLYLHFLSYFRINAAVLSLAAVLGTLLLVWEIKHYGRRIKERNIGGSIVYSVGKRAGAALKRAGRTLGESWEEHQKLIVFYIGFVAVNTIIFLIAGALFADGWHFGLGVSLFLLMMAFDIFILVRLLTNVRGRDEIRKGMTEIAGGNLDYRIDAGKLTGDNRTMAEKLNCVRDGLKHALEAEMKSERLKTDLITNVSHDIKTPLTSIINYVDILKREQIPDERIAGYVDILDKKSMRLKQLTEDLVEASKISSGNITLDMQDINLKQLIKQTNGEFEEKFAAKNLELICTLPESEMIIRADGRRMFRVIENLYNNAAKYAMPNSRVYVSGEWKGGRVIFSMKNISESALNFKADELLERFVRGDVSRSTEGSGLGLEIARNLTVMQNGTFDLYLDGDLFKVTLTFDTV